MKKITKSQAASRFIADNPTYKLVSYREFITGRVDKEHDIKEKAREIKYKTIWDEYNSSRITRQDLADRHNVSKGAVDLIIKRMRKENV